MKALNDCCSCKIVPSFLYSGEADDDTSIIAQLFAVKCCGDIKYNKGFKDSVTRFFPSDFSLTIFSRAPDNSSVPFRILSKNSRYISVVVRRQMG